MFGYGGGHYYGKGQPRSSGPAEYGQQGMASARQGPLKPRWSQASRVDPVPGYKLLLGDVPQHWTLASVSMSSRPNLNQRFFENKTCSSCFYVPNRA